MIKLIVGEPNFGMSLFFDNDIGKITEIRDELFNKRLPIEETLKSITRKIDMYPATSYELLPDESDSIFVQSPFDLNTGLPVKILKQEMSSGKRRIEIFQGKNLGSCAIRFSFYMPRAFKWILNINYVRNKNQIIFDDNIKAQILTPIKVSYSQGSIELSLNDGYSQILLFLNSELDYFNTKKNLLLLDPNDLEKQSIIKAAPNDSNLYPVISFAYLLKSKTPTEKTIDYFNIGSILASAGKYEEAVEHYKKSLAFNEQIGDAIMESKILMNLASVETTMGKNKEALDHYQTAYKLLEEQDNIYLVNSALIAMAKNYYELGEYKQALEYFNHIISTIQEKKAGNETDKFIDEMEESNILSYISKCLMGMGKFEEAVKYQRDALSSIKTMNDLIGESNGLVRLGETLMAVNRIGEAMSCFEQAMRIRNQIGDDRGAADCLKKMGNAFYDRGKFQKAKEYYEKAIKEFKAINDYIDVEKVKRLIDRLKLSPFPNCELCNLKCSEKIRGMARSDAMDPIFRKEFKSTLRDSLASKDMTVIKNFILDQASRNIHLTSSGASPEQYAFCLLLHLSDEYLKKIKTQTRYKIEKMIKDALGI
ncbi:MAG: tetratricopeptide repeat protein [Candidatus Lokiarchaeota archaeon]|nr:tetratricopeptide repeat protein [Candidatus Lokiarchaeota archaeon]